MPRIYLKRLSTCILDMCMRAYESHTLFIDKRLFSQMYWWSTCFSNLLQTNWFHWQLQSLARSSSPPLLLSAGCCAAIACGLQMDCLCDIARTGSTGPWAKTSLSISYKCLVLWSWLYYTLLFTSLKAPICDLFCVDHISVGCIHMATFFKLLVCRWKICYLNFLSPL